MIVFFPVQDQELFQITTQPVQTLSHFGLGKPSANDVYLSPHADDICFSLAALAMRRHSGRLVTIFSITNYHALPDGEIDDTTRLRKSEDEYFAMQAGLEISHLDFPDAPLRGLSPFHLDHAKRTADLIESKLLTVLLEEMQPVDDRRARLFVPCGIGGHVDHVAVTMFVARHATALTGRYDICFYEDLHYASQSDARMAGLRRLFRLFPGNRFRRVVIALGDMQSMKLQLISTYRSQFAHLPKDLRSFVPAATTKGTPLPPHEALLVPILHDARINPLHG